MKRNTSRIKTVALVLVAAFMAALCFSSCCPYMYRHNRYGGPYDRGGSYYEQDYGYGQHHHRHHRHWGS